MSATKKSRTLPIKVAGFFPIGTRVKPYGKIVGIMSECGERYYFLLGDEGGIALMPATTIEPRAPAPSRQRRMQSM